MVFLPFGIPTSVIDLEAGLVSVHPDDLRLVPGNLQKVGDRIHEAAVI